MRNVQDVYEAIVVVDDLMDFRRDASVRKPSVGERPTPRIELREDKSTPRSLGLKGKVIKSGTRREVKCYLCADPHLIRDYPKKKSFNAMVFEDEKEEREESHLGSMRLLNSVAKEEAKALKEGGLMFVKVKTNNKVTKSLLNTGVSHNFLTKSEAEKMNIQYTKQVGWLKTVNSPYEPILGVSYKVIVDIGGWKDPIDLTMVPMDNYFMVLGTNFFDQMRPFFI